MKLTDEEKATLQYYETKADEWTALYPVGSVSFLIDELARFHQLLPSGKVLEVGCGNGREADIFIKQGYTYIGVDSSSKLLTISKKHNPQGTFLKKNLYELDFQKDFFDGFWSAATLLHVPKKRIKDVLKNIQRVTRPGGIGFISILEGEGESVEEETERFFSYYTTKEFSNLLQNANMSIIEQGKKQGGPRRTTWLIYFVRNNGMDK